MSREEMMKAGWRAYMEVLYQHPRMHRPILCLLIEVNFDEETLLLFPLFNEEYVRKDFHAGIQNCSLPRKKMSAEIINGKSVKKVVAGIPEFEGSTDRLNPYFEYENLNDFNDAS